MNISNILEYAKRTNVERINVTSKEEIHYIGTLEDLLNNLTPEIEKKAVAGFVVKTMPNTPISMTVKVG